MLYVSIHHLNMRIIAMTALIKPRLSCAGENRLNCPPYRRRHFILTLLLAMFIPIQATSYAQTTKISVDEEAVAVLESDIVSVDEIDRRFNELRSQYLDDRADSINWWLTVIAIVLTFSVWWLLLPGSSVSEDFKQSRPKRKIAQPRCASASRKYNNTKEQAEKTVKGIRELTSEDVANPAKAEQVEKAVETVRQIPEASPIDKAIAMAYLLQKAGEIEKAIEKWRTIAHLMEKIDNSVAADA